MAVYFDHQIDAPDSNEEVSLIAWHSTQPLLAVGFVNPASGGCIDIYLQQVSNNFIYFMCNVCDFAHFSFSYIQILSFNFVDKPLSYISALDILKGVVFFRHDMCTLWIEKYSFYCCWSEVTSFTNS